MDRDDFTSAMDMDAFMCLICMDVLNKPAMVVGCLNGHMSCVQCLEAWVRENNNCPNCRARGTKIARAIPVQNLILKLDRRCEYEQCEWVGTQEEYEVGHFLGCGFSPIVCGKCHRTIQRQHTDNHNRPIRTCSKCAAEYLDEHDCPFDRIRCPNFEGCKIEGERRWIDEVHLLECSHEVVGCSICPWVGTRNGMALHDTISVSQHIEIMMARTRPPHVPCFVWLRRERTCSLKLDGYAFEAKLNGDATKVCLRLHNGGPQDKFLVWPIKNNIVLEIKSDGNPLRHYILSMAALPARAPTRTTHEGNPWTTFTILGISTDASWATADGMIAAKFCFADP